MSAGTQTLRFRRPQQDSAPKTSSKTDVNDGILQDKVRRTAKPPWSPSFSLAFRILILIRITGAMYSNIDDCDEVYNFWEPLHLLDQGYAFQTWEVSPQYAIRSWAYILLHLLPVQVARFLSNNQKRAAFFAVRIMLATLCTLAEVSFYRKVYENVNKRVGRYLFFILLFNAGMWNASAAFLPSSFAMYTTTFAFGYAIIPASTRDAYRTLIATLSFATGTVVGWPFVLALAIPFVIEELFILSGDRVPASARRTWVLNRWKRLFGAGFLAALVFIPVVGIDTLAYGKLSIVPFNIVNYNILSSGRGPNLYGTSPPSFYIFNLLINFNVVLPFALLALPALGITYLADRGRLGIVKVSNDESSPFLVLALRLAPFYLWLGILSAQAHKEERFMFPVYPLLAFNAAVTIYLIRGWMETAFIAITKSPYRASRTSIFSSFTSSVVVVSALLSVSRIFANWHYYHAPLTIAYNLEMKELPWLLNTTGLLPPPPPSTSRHYREEHTIDLSGIKDFNLTLCVGKEWYRFPGHFLVPNGVDVEFIQHDFHGLLPGHFPVWRGDKQATGVLGLWHRPQTRIQPDGLNDLNQEERSHYVPVSTCDYLIDLDFPEHPVESALEPRYAVQTQTWERVSCLPFLDARYSPLLSRVLWVPGKRWRQLNSWGDYCLLRNKGRVEKKIVKTLVEQKVVKVGKQKKP
ncbi:glycosyltransferase family 22 protein [Moniliophthora roreri MCA 2997]|uniref:Mannosyltransferase n=1 Tax=Moniliophthora roreri (strain MCA 2997) TaxID=1381753 RepID=V2XB27_MONRO|nr:glycosyltransferase family 22 protein [Moniliophthora roreri MCA 2997]